MQASTTNGLLLFASESVLNMNDHNRLLRLAVFGQHAGFSATRMMLILFWCRVRRSQSILSMRWQCHIDRECGTRTVLSTTGTAAVENLKSQTKSWRTHAKTVMLASGLHPIIILPARLIGPTYPCFVTTDWQPQW